VEELNPNFLDNSTHYNPKPLKKHPNIASPIPLQTAGTQQLKLNMQNIYQAWTIT